ncbi:hypothetical protein ABZ897_50985 [Nonomuraea sp. NPDC046802]|uniref:hypothetical protein n=1 Tax=Nonomuraea sp. NPDC046802 TaxID=3154919 RepID=UPI0033F52110
MYGYVNFAATLTLAQEMADELGDGFRVQQWDRGPYYGPHLALVSGDLRIALHHKNTGERARERLRFKGLTPGPDLDRALRSPGLEISARMNRPPASIARQITTTLLPRYRPRVVTERAQWDLDLHQHTVREAEAARLASVLPSGRHYPDTYMSVSSTARWDSRRGHGGIHVFGSDGGLTYNASFTAFQLSPAELDIVLALVHSLTPTPTSGQATAAPAG